MDEEQKYIEFMAGRLKGLRDDKEEEIKNLYSSFLNSLNACKRCGRRRVERNYRKPFYDILKLP